MDNLTPDAIWYLFLFLILGFLTTVWMNIFVPLRPKSDNKSTLAYILFSSLLALPWLLYQGWYGHISCFHQFSELAVNQQFGSLPLESIPEDLRNEDNPPHSISLGQDLRRDR